MKPAYRGLAVAAAGTLLVAIATNIARRARAAERPGCTQVLTCTRSHEEVSRRLGTVDAIARAVSCDHVEMISAPNATLVEWLCRRHPAHAGRLALRDAPGNRGTELSLFMHAQKDEVKETVRRFKALLETGEIPTGRRSP